MENGKIWRRQNTAVWIVANGDVETAGLGSARKTDVLEKFSSRRPSTNNACFVFEFGRFKFAAALRALDAKLLQVLCGFPDCRDCTRVVPRAKKITRDGTRKLAPASTSVAPDRKKPPQTSETNCEKLFFHFGQAFPYRVFG